MMITTSLLVTYVVFGAIGFLISRKVKVKPSTFGWIFVATLVLLSQWILPGTRVIVVFQFEMYANRILQAFFFGVLVGLMSKSIKSS